MIKYMMFDYFDKDQANPVLMDFNRIMNSGDTFSVNDVEYQIVSAKHTFGVNNTMLSTTLVTRMIRYKIGDEATQIVHKCPAKREMLDQLGRDDVIKIEEKKGKRAANTILSERVKTSSYQLQHQCPHCKVIFWKEKNLSPQKVEVDPALKKKKRGG